MCQKLHSPIKSVSSYYCPDIIPFKSRALSPGFLNNLQLIHLPGFLTFWTFLGPYRGAACLLKINGFQMPFKPVSALHLLLPSPSRLLRSLTFCINIELEIVSKEVFGLLINPDSLSAWDFALPSPWKSQVGQCREGREAPHWMCSWLLALETLNSEPTMKSFWI